MQAITFTHFAIIKHDVIYCNIMTDARSLKWLPAIYNTSIYRSQLSWFSQIDLHKQCCSFLFIPLMRAGGVWLHTFGRPQSFPSGPHPLLYSVIFWGVSLIEYAYCCCLWEGGWPISCQEAKSLYLSREERVDDENYGLGTTVEIQLLEKEI